MKRLTFLRRVDLLLKKITILIGICLFAHLAFAQINTKKQHAFRDSLDNAFDLSHFILEMKGFVPLPFVITEPALGDIGGGLALIFIKRHPFVYDSTKRRRPLAPDITGAGGMYTANNSWGFMAFRSATFVKARIKYKALGGFADVNLNFYRSDQEGKEHEYAVKLRTFPFSTSFQRHIGSSAWTAGVQYLFLRTEASMQSGSLPEWITSKEIRSDVSIPGVLAEMDTRDNIFTPDRGTKLHASMGFSDGSFGSDYDFYRLQAFVYSYFPIAPRVTTGLRFQLHQVFEEAPFYLLPFVELRGVPTARYQGNISPVAEAEFRWDVVTRWSVVVFGGSGKAFDTWDDFKDSDWISAGGGGFRYLLARRLKLRMGVDVARGPEQWAYYLVFGSAWLR